MTKLEEIFSIEDIRKRQKALVDYASILKINTHKAKKPNGKYNENYLAVLIHDAEKRKSNRIFSNTGLLVAGALIMGTVLACIFLLTKLMNNVSGSQ